MALPSQNTKKHPCIAREGWPFIILSLVITLCAYLFSNITLLVIAVFSTIFMLQFFRDPKRVIYGKAGDITCPADGRIMFIGPAKDPYQNQNALKISIFMNVFNVHANRSPIEGQVKNKWYFAGKFFNAALDKASTQNERCAIHLKTQYGSYDITVVQIAGLIARRILNYTDLGHTLTRGERFGFIRFGSRVDLYLPENSEPLIALGTKVKSSRDILARLPEANNNADSSSST